MPQVTVKDCAHFDARLRLAGRLLRMNHERVGWRLIQIWSLATAQNSPVIALALAAEAIGRNADDVARAFTSAQLAEPAGNDRLDLSPMQSLFGDCNWLHDKKGSAPAGGKARAATATRAPDGTFASGTPDQPLRHRIVEQLGVGKHSRELLRAALRCRNAAMLTAVRDLIDEGVVVDEDGQLSLVPAMEPMPGTGHPESNGERPVPGIARLESIPGTTPESDSHTAEREPSSALALAPSLAPAHTRAREGTGNRESAKPAQPPDSLASEELVPDHQRRPVARLLWAYQNQCRAELDTNAPTLPLNDVPGGSLDAVILRLASYTPSQCRHALDMFKLEGKLLGDDGENPLQYLNGFTNWKTEPFGRRVGMTADAVAHEARARKAIRAKKGTQTHPPPRRNRLN